MMLASGCSSIHWRTFLITRASTVSYTHLLEALIRPDTRLAVITHVSNVTGMVQPLEEIIPMFHRHGIPVVVDGAQSAGHIPVSYTHLDVYKRQIVWLKD